MNQANLRQGSGRQACSQPGPRSCSAVGCSASFEITADDLAALQKVSPFIAGTMQRIPAPTRCPQCRLQRRVSYRNDQHYYRHTCQLCQNPVVSIYSPDKNIPVLCTECFWGDGWDPLSFGVEYDERRPFFEQFFAMKSRIPRLAIFYTQSENSEFTVHSSRNKNCYMCSSAINNEDLLFSDQTFDSRNCMDMLSCMKMECCYWCTFSLDCFGSVYVDHCSNLASSMYCYDCRGSQDLVGCVGIRNTSAMILNKSASKETCAETMQKLKIDPTFREEFLRKYRELQRKYPHRAAWQIQTENCTGNELLQCKGVFAGFDLKDIEDGRYVVNCVHSKDLYDCTKVIGEMNYECKGAVDLTLSCVTNLCYQSDNLLYCDNCQGSSFCFGCMSLKKHRYCIFNTQYSQEEYEILVPKIIENMREREEWGEFFPSANSPFGYNETKAQEWFPLNKEEALNRGWKWSEYEPPEPGVTKKVPAQKLPTDICSIPDDILNWAIICSSSGKPFRIVKNELSFYRDNGLPVPLVSPRERHKQRVQNYNFRQLFNRSCDKCGNSIQTSYAPDRPEIVYCEECYLKEVY